MLSLARSFAHSLGRVAVRSPAWPPVPLPVRSRGRRSPVRPLAPRVRPPAYSLARALCAAFKRSSPAPISSVLEGVLRSFRVSCADVDLVARDMTIVGWHVGPRARNMTVSGCTVGLVARRWLPISFTFISQTVVERCRRQNAKHFAGLP